MAQNLDEDLQGLLKALAALILAFGCLAVLISLFGTVTVEQLLP